MSERLAGLAEQEVAELKLTGVRPAGLETLLGGLAPQQAAFARAQGFNAAAGDVLRLPGAAWIGLGTGPALHGFGAAAFALPGGSVWRLESEEPDAAALGFLLGAYRYESLKTVKKPPALLAADQVPPRIRAIAGAIFLARDLINTPANLLGPHELAEAALAVGARFGAAATRIHGAELAARYPAMAAVGAGSERGAEAVRLEWQGSIAGADAPLVSLCGKGVCFDTGGYDLKPSAAMLRMKKDMGGAAILLGLAQAVMALDLPVRLQLRIGCVENSISGHAMRPSDVLQTHAGLSVEVGNTDAEGRLVLCDLLAEAAAEQPHWLIDAATLTGAARVALGPDLPALFCTDDELSEIILQSGRKVNDPLWRLPLFEGYDSWLDSPVADLATVSAKPLAGAIIAGLFLKRFVPQQIAWAHVDVYAWNDGNRAGRPEGGEAQSLRALLQAIETLSLTARLK
jgi:leucyl aminopeptidase